MQTLHVNYDPIDPSWTEQHDDTAPELNPEAEESENKAEVIPLSQFVADFGDGLRQAVSRQNPPVYDGKADWTRDLIMDGLKHKPFPAQREVVQAVTKLLVNAGEDAAIINAEMGTGKVRRIGAWKECSESCQDCWKILYSPDLSLLALGNLHRIARSGEAVLADVETEVLRHLEARDDFSDPKADGGFEALRGTLGQRGGDDLVCPSFGGTQQFFALSGALLGQQRIATHCPDRSPG